MTTGTRAGKYLRLTVLSLATAALIAAAIGCGDGQEGPTTAAGTNVTEGSAAPAASPSPQEAATPASPSPAEPHPLASAARAAAVAHEGLTEQQAARLELTTWEAVTWPDAALGCQKEGFMYAAVLTPGFKATYEYEGRTIVVHLGEREDSAFVPQDCVNRATAGPPRGEQAQSLPAEPHPLENAARAAAVAHEGLSEEQAARLELTLWEAVTWPDAALGCQKEGYGYAAVLTPGFRAAYEYEGRTITVHLGEDGDSAFVPQDCVNDPATTGYPRGG